MSMSLAPALPVSRHLLIGGLTLLVGLLFIGSIVAGREPLALLATLRQVLAHEPSLLGLVLVEIRLPRAVLGLMVGATLGLAGAALQALWHLWLIKDRSREGCFKAFRLNHWVGLSVFAGLALSYT